MSEPISSSTEAIPPIVTTDGTLTNTDVESETTIRRVGRVERWLRKGYGFIIDLGRLAEDDNTTYGWVADEMSGSKAFVYHDALRTQSEHTFHRLFAHEYVEYNIDTSLPKRDGRSQAFAVTGLAGLQLLCDLNATEDESGEGGNSGNNQNRRRNSPDNRQRRGGNTGNRQQRRNGGGGGGGGNNHNSPQPTVIYYVPTTGLPGGIPGGVPGAASEPSYVMPASGIPVPQ